MTLTLKEIYAVFIFLNIKLYLFTKFTKHSVMCLFELQTYSGTSSVYRISFEPAEL